MFVKVTVYHLLNRKQFSEFSWRTQRSRAPNKETQLYSHTRGKKTEESPFCGSRTGITKQSNGNPQRGMKLKIMKCHWTHAASKALNNSSRINSGSSNRLIKPRKANSGLWYCEVCKVTRRRSVFNFLCSDLSLCTIEFKLNKVFDFKI